jgi:hypothetical protein
MTAGSASAGAGTVEIRAVPPQGRLLLADKMTLRKWALQANSADGTITLTEDRMVTFLPPRTVVLALPSTGRPDAVRTVCLADYRWIRNLQTGVTWRLLFLDGEGRTLHNRARDQPKASQMWPRALFTPLEPLGISVTEEHFASTKAFRTAHPDVRIFA